MAEKKRLPIVNYDKVNNHAQISRPRNWKPASMKLPFLAAIAILCLLCIVFLELLVRNSVPLDQSVFDMNKRDISPFLADTAGYLPVAFSLVLLAQATSATTSICPETSTTFVTAVAVVSKTATNASPLMSSSHSRVKTPATVMDRAESVYLQSISSNTSLRRTSHRTMTKLATGLKYIRLASSDSYSTTTPLLESVTTSDAASPSSLTTTSGSSSSYSTNYITASSSTMSVFTTSNPATYPPSYGTTYDYMLSSSMLTTSVYLQPTTLDYGSISRATTIADNFPTTNYIIMSSSVSQPIVAVTTVHETAMLSAYTTGLTTTALSSVSQPTKVLTAPPGMVVSSTNMQSASAPSMYLPTSDGLTESSLVGPYIAAESTTAGSKPESISTFPPEMISATSNYLTASVDPTPGAQQGTTLQTHITNPQQSSNRLLASATAKSDSLTQLTSRTVTRNNGPGDPHTTTPVAGGVESTPMATVFTSDGKAITSTVADTSSTIIVFTSAGGEITSTIVATPATSHVPPRSTDSALQKSQHGRRPDLLLQGGWSNARYFAAVYLPSILAVIIKEAWAMTAAGMKIVEPFYQLSKPNGADVRTSLMDDYLGGTNSPNTIANALRGRSVFMAIVVVNLIVDLLAPISTQSMAIIPLSHFYNDSGELIIYNPGWALDRTFVRLLQSMLSLLLFVILSIAILDRRRRSGLSANPSMITTMTSLLNNSNIVRDFSRISTNTFLQEIEASIAHSRYRITSNQNLHGRTIWGLTRMDEAIAQRALTTTVDEASNLVRSVGPIPVGETKQHRIKRFIWSRLVDGLVVLLIVGIFAVITAYWVGGSNSGFVTYFNSARFGPRFVLSLGASITTITFQSFEREVRLMTPYRLLVRGNASSRDTVLRPVDGTAVSGLIQSLNHRALFPAFLALVTLSGDVLIIMASSVPYSAGQMYTGLMTSCSFSVAIAVIMLGAAIAVFCWRQKNKRLRIPPGPNGSLMATWISLSNSGNQLRAICNEYEDTSKTTLKRWVEGDGGRYWAGWIRDKHGQEVWCVDKENVDRGLLFAQADLNGGRLSPSQDTERDNPYTLTNYQNALPTLPFIQTEYQEAAVQRGEQTEYHAIPAEHENYVEQTIPDLQIEHRDTFNFQSGYEQRFSRSWSDYSESDISDMSNIGRAHSYVPTEYR